MNKQEKTEDYLWFGLFLILAVLSSVVWFEKRIGICITGDGTLYYKYFTRIFITHNLHEKGLIKFPVGTSLLQLPFLLAAYGISSAFKIDLMGGKNLLFQHAVFFAALFWSLFGFLLLFRFLRRKYSTAAAVLSCFCLFYGTMLPVYITEKASYSHTYGFFMCTVFWVYISYYEENRNKKSLLKRFILDLILGALLGFCAIVRNTNVIIGVAYAFYGVASFQDLGNRIRNTIITKRLIPQIIGFGFIFGIQMVFWKIMTDKWIIYSYNGETFTNFTKPQILSVLFSDAKGLFVFCPVLMIAMLSMVFFRKKNGDYRVSQWIIFLGVTYIISAWWCWWLGSAYGERMFCDVLCIFALPLAAFFDNLKRWSNKLKKGHATKMNLIPAFCYISVVIFVAFNVAMIYATSTGAVSDNFATWHELRSFLTGM